jgi:hypothetical protein
VAVYDLTLSCRACGAVVVDMPVPNSGSSSAIGLTLSLTPLQLAVIQHEATERHQAAAAPVGHAG